MTENHIALPEGFQLGDYVIKDVLGTGGFGITYLATDVNLGKPVAIKEYLPSDIAVRAQNSHVLPKTSADRDEFEWGLDRFLEEARILALFRHVNIIEVYRFFEKNGTGYIVMEFADGETLSSYLKKRGPLSVEALRKLLLPIMDGLQAVHEADYLHRDIKPGNIIIRANGSPVLLDFGAARQALEARNQAVTAIITPGYAPIEQYSTTGGQGPWSDIYALAAVAYRCLTGAPPDDATDRVQDDPLQPLSELLKDEQNSPFLSAIDWGLRLYDEERPSSIEEWRKALNGNLEDISKVPDTASVSLDTSGSDTEDGSPKSKQPQSAEGKSIWKPTLAAAAVLLLVVAGAVSFNLVQNQGEDDEAAWQVARTENTVGSYQNYLQTFPDGRFADAAELGLAEALDRTAWQQASETDTAEALGAYITSFPNGQFVSAANERIAELTEAARLTAQQRAEEERDRQVRAAWQISQSENTADAYQAFLTQYPDSEFAEAAATALGQIRRANTERSALIERIVDRLAQLGYETGPESGTLTRQLSSAIRQFEADESLPPTGQATPDLIARLDQVIGQSIVINDVQRELRRMGYSISAISGRLDGPTRQALEHFARATSEQVVISPDQRFLDRLKRIQRKPLVSGDRVQDCNGCPDMVAVIPAPFSMGDHSGSGEADERPRRTVTLAQAYAMSRTEVTRQDFGRFISESGYRVRDRCWIQDGEEMQDVRNRSWVNPGFQQTATHPVVCVNARDADAYVGWLANKTGRAYRLPTEAEWEFAARAGSSNHFHYGANPANLCRYGNGADQSTNFPWKNTCNDGHRWTSPAGTFASNAFGIHDLNGNAFEWVADCWNASYSGAPSDGSAWRSGDCERRVLRGGSWMSDSFNLRSANRISNRESVRANLYGFRIVRALSASDGIVR